MFTRILIANRGEIACRVARTARRMGIRTIAIYSDADADALHVESCDEAYRVGPPPPRESYLDIAGILAVAKRAGAQAIHPGYGFLSENEGFAQACADAALVFIGPPPAAIAAMGSKSAAKRIMAAAGVPVVPGYHGDDQDPKRLAREAEAIGFPVLIKATAGGGGKGMKIVAGAGEFAAALASAQREARASFDDDRVLLESYLQAPRHIEIQVFADAHGNALHLFERDCSVQRRHQKVLEEAPAPGMTGERRAAMGEAAVAAARAIGYVGAGTVEFIADASFASTGRFYFMEMNTRLQVEHPVTEMVTGLDLVEWQLRVASGEALPLRQDQVPLNGHAIEARIYAEDPDRGFLPSIGTITRWRMPDAGPDVRIDTGFRRGDTVTPFYDPMLAKLVAWGGDRDHARARLLAALRQCDVGGVTSNIDFLARVVDHPVFAGGNVDTGLIDKHRDELFPAPAPLPDRALVALAVAELVAIEARAQEQAAQSPDPHSPWHWRDGWTNGSAAQPIVLHYETPAGAERVEVLRTPDRAIEVLLRAARRRVRARVSGDELLLDDAGSVWRTLVVANGDQRRIRIPDGRFDVRFADPLAQEIMVEERAGHLMAPMSGTVIAVMVKAGDKVAKGTPLVLLEAMKMEHTIAAPAPAVVVAVNCAVGERVAEGADLVDLSDAPG